MITFISLIYASYSKSREAVRRDFNVTSRGGRSGDLLNLASALGDCFVAALLAMTQHP